MSQLESDSFFQSFPAITTLLSTYTAECNKLTQVLRKLSNNFVENVEESVTEADTKKRFQESTWAATN